MAVVIFVAAAGGWVGFLRLTGNIHVVDAGNVYRSGQLSPAQLTRLIRERRVRTVINLRGSSPGARWYEDELLATAAAGAQHFDIRLSATAAPPDTLIARLRTLLRVAARPVLLHCEAGADRSGLASALYELDEQGVSPAEADAQLSLRYGHFPWLGSKTDAMDRTFWRVVAARGSQVLSPGSPGRGPLAQPANP